jgi:hypothetical protein
MDTGRIDDAARIADAAAKTSSAVMLMWIPLASRAPPRKIPASQFAT